MRRKRLVAGILTLLIAGQTMATSSAVTASAAETQSDSSFNGEGLWLTEIYANDVDRSKENNNRESSGYESIRLYDTTLDLMEFIEFTSTYENSISLNDMYEVIYDNSKVFNVTDMNGNSDVTIEPGQEYVLWNCRDDIENSPTEAEFREEMRVSDDAVILKTNYHGNWKASTTFSLKTKADDKIVSTYTITDKEDSANGFSVELKIPVIGSEMGVYRAMNEASPGYIYSGQLHGLIPTETPEETYAEGVYISEIRPNDISRSAAYGVSGDMLECVEIMNTTANDVELNKDYQLMFFLQEGNRVVEQIHHYDENAELHTGSSDGCIVPAGGTAVLWIYREAFLSSYTNLPTEEDFRTTYDVPDDVPVYIVTNQNSVGNANRGFELYKINDDGTKDLVSNYCYIGSTDCKDNTSAHLAVNPEGPEMLLYSANAKTTMGIIDPEQYTYQQDDGSSLTLRLADGEEVPESIMQGEELRVNFYYEVTSTVLPRTGLSTYYRFDGEGAWYNTVSGIRSVPNLYDSTITADELFDHDYVEFFACADNRCRSTLSDIYKVNITKINDVDGIRTNISEGEEVSDTVTFTANDGADNANTEIYIDGKKYTTTAVLEDGAYFNFKATGRANYYKSLLTTTENDEIARIGRWHNVNLDGRVIKIDNSYFTCNAETDSYDTTLRFWSGTYGATVDDYLCPTADRDEYNVTDLAMKLANGNTYYPTAIGPDDTETSTKTNLSTDYSAVHGVGDASGYSHYLDVSFSIPASGVTAVGAVVDTNELSNGKHTLKVTNGTSTKEVTFIVDNKAPVIDLGVEDGADLTGNITIDPQVTEENTLENLIVTLDDEQIETPYETTAYKLGEGEHTLSVYAEDRAGKYTTETATFTISDVSVSVTNAGTTDITDSSASLYLTVDNTSSDTQATFYKAEKVDTADITTNTTTGILPYIQYTINVGEVANDDVIVANWDGTASNSDDTHASTMYVLNTSNGKWDKIAKADDKGSITEASFVAENHVKDGKATIIVQCTANSSLPDLETETDGKIDTNANWDGESVPEDYDFCFAWETDTQYYSEQWQYHYLNMNQWIVDNAEDLKIKYVIHTGDLVDDHEMLYQWKNADEAMKIFDDAGMPYGVLGGNHDVASGLDITENYYTYFGEDRFTSQETYGESYKNNLGHYDLVSENGQDFVLVYMSWNIYQDEIDWMNDVLQKYSDRKAILLFHPYTNVKQSNGTFLDYFGELIQKEVVAKNPNVFAVLNGHYHGSSYETAFFDDDNDGVNDRTVYQICTDYQSGFEGGSEYIKFLYFDLDNDKIYMNSYSPYLDDYNYFDTDSVEVLNTEGASSTGLDKMLLGVDFDADEQTILENQFSAYVYTSEELGTASVDKLSGKATLDISELESETNYLWYAVVTNTNTGYHKTGLYDFTTEENTTPDTEIGSVNSYSITLDGKIGVNFYMELEDAYVNDPDTYMNFTLLGPSTDSETGETTYSDEKYSSAVSVSDAAEVEIEGKTCYKFTFYVSAKEMTCPIKAQITHENDDGTVKEGSVFYYSVLQYASEILNSDSDDYKSAVPVVEAMLNYGGYSQEYFKFNLDDLANGDFSDDEKALPDTTAADLNTYAPEVESNSDDIDYYGSSLVLKSGTQIKHYFTLNSESQATADDFYAVDSNGNEYELRQSGNYLYVQINNIPAHKLGDNLDITIYHKQNTDSAACVINNYSPLSYAYNVLSSYQSDGSITDTTHEELVNVVKALYQYYAEAKSYYEAVTTA